jgi:hypothetical protein
MGREPIEVVRLIQGYLWTVRDGKAVRFEWFTSPEEALAAVGMAGKAQEPGDNALSG